MHLNVRGIRAKLDEIQMFLNEEQPYIFSLNETF